MRTLIWHKLIIVAIVLLALMTCTKLSVNQTAPDVPSAPSPADGGALDSVSIELSWICSDPNGDPLTYDIYLDTSSTPEVLVATVDTTSYAPVGLHYNSTYYWQVVATDTTGLETEGPIWSFSFGTDMIVPSCSLIAPNGGELWYIGADYDITWEASDDDSIAFFVLEYSIDEINNWVMIGDTIDGNTRDTSWTIPSTPTLIGRVRIFCQDFGGNAVSDTSDDFFTMWPQGGMIAFTSDRDGTYDIFTIYADGSNPLNLINSFGGDYHPEWSPDCSQIVFMTDRDGNNEIYIMSNDGTVQMNISSNPNSDLYPTWSPLGDKIAFGSNRRNTSYYDIWTMNVDGTSQNAITGNNWSEYGAVWSPTGEQIAYHSLQFGNWDIFTIDSEGLTVPQRLTTNAASDLWPAWSPDGQLIAFTSYRDGQDEIYTMNANGSNPQRITTHAAGDWNPGWSPDGTRIIFQSSRSGDWELWTMDPDGSNLVNISNDLGYDGYGSWSPIH